MKDLLLKQLDTVDRLASGSKIRRFLNKPYKYVYAILFKELVYPRSKKGLKTSAKLFYGKDMIAYLPASTDIYLTGGKSHPSEIRLAKFLISCLEKGDHFLDIGAHYGYFSLLASQLVGTEGRVVSYEPSSLTFTLLQENAQVEKNISVYNEAVSDHIGRISFYEFPNLYSEYNAADIEQFNKEDWYGDFKPREVKVSCTTLDSITAGGAFNPRLIKIDVEGGENKVVSGGIDFLKNNSPRLILEFLSAQRGNAEHQKALNQLRGLGYISHIISGSGGLEIVQDIDSYLDSKHLESDNIVFVKGASS